MNRIIKIIILGVIVTIPVIVIASEISSDKETAGVKYSSGEKTIETQIDRGVLSSEVILFKTKADEKRVLHNKKRLDIYKDRLGRSNIREGKKNILVTGYSSTPDQCWGDPFQTASGTRVHRGTMACPPQYPFGTKIEIENMGTFICEDRGGAIKGNHFDMWFTSRGEALNWGKRIVMAEISK